MGRQTVEPGASELAGLLSCLLAVVSVCLTAFNLYLFALVWSSLSAAGSSGSGWTVAPESAFVRRIELLGGATIKFTGKLASERLFSVEQIRGHTKQRIDDNQSGPANETILLKLSSKNSIELGASRLKNWLPSLILSAKQRQLQFPNGLKVHHLDAKSDRRPAIECDAHREEPVTRRYLKTVGASCRLHAAKIKLANELGVDFRRLSIQAPTLTTRRLHSPTNKLQILSQDESLIESRTDRVELTALEGVSLGSRNATVIIDAKTINLGQRVALGAAGQLVAGGYRLCVCLWAPSAEPRRATGVGAKLVVANDNRAADLGGPSKRGANDGIVFAVRNNLACSQFSLGLCGGKNSRRKQST